MPQTPASGSLPPAGDDVMDLSFYGVRGSLPAPRSGREIQAQIAQAVYEASRSGRQFDSPADAEQWLVRNLPFHRRSCYGGDTTCILVRCGDTRVIVDAGSGIRRLGADLMPEVTRNGSLEVHMLFTHMHLDHIMGFAFFAPLFAPKRKFDVRLLMHGGDAWRADLQTALSSTVSAPLFPVGLDKLALEAATLEYHPIYDGLSRSLGSRQDVRVYCRRLHHPNETYGFRIEYRGMSFVVATDTEPYAGQDPNLHDLAAGADVLYLDAQYDLAQYQGGYDGVSRVGWGHGYAEWCAATARELGVRLLITGHHDPAASPERVFQVGETVRAGFPDTVIGFDGMRMRLSEEEVTVYGAGEAGADVTVARG